MRKFKKIIITCFLILFSSMTLAADNKTDSDKDGSFLTSIAYVFKTSKEDYEKLNPKTLIPYKDAAYEFCNQTTSYETTTYQNAAPKGILYACQEDAMLNIFFPIFGIDNLKGLVDEDSFYSNAVKAMGIGELSFETIEAGEQISFTRILLSGLLSLYGLYLIFFVSDTILKITKTYNGDFINSAYLAMKATYKRILILVGGFLFLFTPLGLFLTMFMAAITNGIQAGFTNNGLNMGSLSTTNSATMAMEAQIPMINSDLNIMALEAQQTLYNRLGNSTAHHYNMDKNWSIFNYGKKDITRPMAVDFDYGVRGSIQFEADLDNSLFSDLVQTEKNCLKAFKTYKSGLIDVNLNLGIKGVHKCVKLTDKTDFTQFVENSKVLTSLFKSNFIQAAQNVNLKFKVLNPLAQANESGFAMAKENLTKPDALLAVAKEAITTNKPFVELDSYQKLVESNMKFGEIFQDIDAASISPEDQKIFNALNGVSFIDAARFSGFEIDYEDEYGLDQLNVLNMWYQSVFLKGYREFRNIECSKLSNPEKAAKWREKDTSLANSEEDWRGYQLEKYCTEIVKDKFLPLGASTDVELYESKVLRDSYYLVYEIYQKMVIDVMIENYNNYVSALGNAKDYVDNQKMGWFSYFFNLPEKKRNADKFARVKTALNKNMVITDSYDYEKGVNHNFVIANSTPDHKNNLFSVNADYAMSPKSINVVKKLDDAEAESDSLIKEAIKMLFESNKIECINDSSLYGEGFCEDETFFIVMQSAENSIETGIKVIAANLIFQIGDEAVDVLGKYTKIGGPIAILVQLLLKLAIGLGALILPFFAMIAYIKITISVLSLLAIAYIALIMATNVILWFVQIFIDFVSAIFVNTIVNVIGGEDNDKNSIIAIVGHGVAIPTYIFFNLYLLQIIDPQFNALIMKLLHDTINTSQDGLILYSFMEALRSIMDTDLLSLFLILKLIAMMTAVKVAIEHALRIAPLNGLGWQEAVAMAAPAMKVGSVVKDNVVSDKAITNVRNKARSALEKYSTAPQTQNSNENELKRDLPVDHDLPTDKEKPETDKEADLDKTTDESNSVEDSKSETKEEKGSKEVSNSGNKTDSE